MTSQTASTESKAAAEPTKNQVKRSAPEDVKSAEWEPLWKKPKTVSFENGEDTKMEDGNENQSGNGVDANGENDDGETGDQFARVVFCLDNAAEIAQSLQPGYQVSTRISKTADGRYVCATREIEHYHHRVDCKNSNRKPQFGKMATGDRQNMMEKKQKVEKMARCMIAGETATFTVVCDSVAARHVTASFEHESVKLNRGHPYGNFGME